MASPFSLPLIGSGGKQPLPIGVADGLRSGPLIENAQHRIGFGETGRDVDAIGGGKRTRTTEQEQTECTMASGGKHQLLDERIRKR